MREADEGSSVALKTLLFLLRFRPEPSLRHGRSSCTIHWADARPLSYLAAVLSSLVHGDDWPEIEWLNDSLPPSSSAETAPITDSSRARCPINLFSESHRVKYSVTCMALLCLRLLCGNSNKSRCRHAGTVNQSGYVHCVRPIVNAASAMLRIRKLQPVCCEIENLTVAV